MRDMGKYRGIRKDNGEMVYGWLCEIEGKVFIAECPVSAGYNGGSYADNNISGWYEVIPETVGEFTTLMDKNATNIYEGDEDEKDQIVFWNQNGSWCIRTKDGCVYDLRYWEFEVIGNIHEELKGE